jgi:hypothetical protein
MKVWSYLEKLGSSDLNGNFAILTALIAKVDALVPVGSLLWFDDLNGVNTVDSAYWAAHNGQTISDPASVYNGKVLEDMSNRYVVGYGTEAAGDIISMAYAATSVVGNASHQVDLAHSHAVAKWNNTTAFFYHFAINDYGNMSNTVTQGIQFPSPNYASGNYSHYSPVSGGTGTLGTGTVDVYSQTSGSATQSIQPRSIRNRAYRRIK